MPWINREMCTGCEICVDECCVDAIAMDDGVAWIDESICIRCGVCHDVCPVEAVRHDGERIPEEVKSHVAWIQGLLNHDYYADDTEKQKALVKRLRRHFIKNRKVMEKTIEYLKNLEDTQYADQPES